MHHQRKRFSEGEIVPGPKGEPTFVRYQAVMVPKFWLLSRNVQALLQHLAPEGELVLDFDDEITAGACVVRPKEVAA